jgi:Ca2+-binding RTX toxin-like protein
MPNQTVTIKLHDAKTIISALQVTKTHDQPVTIQAQKGINYELIDDATQFAPENIKIQRVGNDLYIGFEDDGVNALDPDLIIQGYYGTDGTTTNLLIGLHENGSYYAYVPETGAQQHAVSMLADQVSVGQALGGEPLTSASYEFNPYWLLALIPLVGLAAAGGGGGGGTPSPSADKPDVVALNGGVVTVKPGSNNVKQVITYTDESNNAVTLTASKGSDGKWSLDTTPTGVSIDSSTGLVTIGMDAVKDGSIVTSTGTNSSNNTATDSDTAKIDDSTPTSADVPDVVALVGGAVTVTPGADNVKEVISYTDESNNAVTLTASKGASGTWSLDSTPIGVSINPATGVVTIGMEAVKDGSVVTAVGSDQFDNTASDSDTARLDVTSYTVTFDSITTDTGSSNSDFITNDNTLLFKGTIDLSDGNTLSVKVGSSTYLATDPRLTVDGSGNWTLDLTGTTLLDGTYAVVATVTDSAGNSKSTTTQNVVIDTQIDTDNDGQTVSFDSITDDTGTADDFITNDNSLLFKGTVDLGDGNSLSVTVGATTYTTADPRLTVDGSGNWTLDLTGTTLLDGTYAVVATVTDTAGNTASSTSQNVVIDTKVDKDGDGDIVTFDSITNDTGSSSSDFITNDNTLLFKGTVDLDDGNSLSVTVGATTYTTADPRLTIDGLGNWTLDLTGSALLDGSYTVVATVTDTMGNTGNSISRNVVIDTKIDTDNDGQTVTFDSITNDTGSSNSDFITNDNTLLFKGTVDLGDGNSLSVKVGSTTYLATDPRLTVDGSGNWTLDLTGTTLADATYAVVATVTDTAGNTASSTSQNVVIDTQIDTDNDGQTVSFDSITNDTGSSNSDFITNDNTLLFKGTVDLGDGNSLSVKVGSTTYLATDPRLTVDGSGNWTLDLTGTTLADNTYAVVATVTDTAGNTASSTSQNVVIDTQIDTDNDGQIVTFDSITNDTGSSNSDFITNDNTLLFKGTVDLGDGNSLSVTVGATTYTTADSRLTVDGSGNWTLDLTGTTLADATYAVVATVTDTAGNTASSTSQNVVIDTKIDTDNDGQTVTFDSITNDTGSSNSDFITNDNTLLFKGTVDLVDGNSLSVKVGSTTYVATDPRLTVDGSGNWTLDLTGTTLADATYAVVATVTDTAGNTASSTSQNVVIDTKIDTDNDGQTVTFDSITNDTGSSNSDFITNDNILLFKGTVDLGDGNSLSVTVGTTTYTTTDPRLTVDGLGNWTLDLTGSALLDGSYAVVATVTDTAGNTASSTSQNVVIDTKIDTDNDGQTVTFDSITNDTGSSNSDFITNDNTLLFKGTVDLADGNSLSVTVGATTYTTADPRLTIDPLTGAWTLNLTGTTLADATYAVVATVTDTAGNTASSNQDVIIDTVADAPDVIAVSGGSVGIVPGADNIQQVITYTNELDVNITLTATKASDGTWTLDTTPLNVSINSTTGVVSLGRDAVKDGSLVTSIGTDSLGNTAQDSGTAYSDDLTPSTADQPDVVALDDGSVTVTPGADNVHQDITFTDENNNSQIVTVLQAPDGTWYFDDPAPTGVSLNTITGVVTIGQDAVKDRSVVTSSGFDVSSNFAIDSDTAKGDVVTITVSEEGLAGANADAVGNPVDTTNATSITGTLNLGNLTNVAVAGPSGITSGGQTVTWNGSITAGVYTLTGTAGGKEVAVLTLSTSGAYTFTLKQPIDHSIASLENILGLGFTIASTDAVGTTNSTLVINVEDDSPIAAPSSIHNVDVQPAAIEGDLVVSYGADHGHVQSISVDGYTLTYSSITDSISASGTAGSITYSFNAVNDELTINKGTGEVLVVDMLTGHYSYSSLAITTAAQAPIVGINKSASLLGLVNAEALDLIGIGTNQLLTAVDPNNDIKSVVVNAGAAISIGVLNYYKLDWSAEMAAEFGIKVVEENDIINLLLVTTQSYSKLTITSLDGGPIDNFKLNEFLATVYVHQYGVDLVSLGLAPTISISATDSQPVTSTTSYTDLLGVSLLDPSNDPAGVVEGTSGTNTLNGTNGDDRLYGYAGNDNLTGNQGNDLLRGGAGNDILSGGAGNDILSGGTGNDTLTGGSGNDTFLWEKGDQGTVVAPAVDTITDFSKQPVAGGGDILDLRGLLVGELAKGTSIGNLANYLYFVFDGTNTILYISTAGTLSAATPATTSDQHITFSNVDLVGSYTTQQEIISNLLKNGNLLVDQATTNTDLNGSSSFDVVIVDNDGDTASTNITFDSTSPSTSGQPNVAPIAQANDATLLGLIGVDALGIIDLNQQAFIAVDANQNLRSVEVKFNGLLTVNLGSLSFSASAQLAADLGLEIHINNTSGVLGVVGATSTITITALDGGNIDNLAVNELLATIQLNSDVNLLGLVAGLNVSALGSFTVTATDSYGATDSDSFSSLLNAQVLQNLLGSGGNPDIIQGTSANDTLNNSVSGTIHERLYGYDGDDTLNGGSGNDLLRGGAGNDILNGGDGNDLLIDGNGADTFNGGNGNDVIVISGTGFVSIDGGAGTDTLTLLGGIDLDLTTSNNITNIERIDLGNGAEGSKLTLTAADVLEVTGSNTLQIFGDSHDQVQMIGAIKGIESTINGVTMTQYTLVANTVFVDNDIVNGMGVIVL